MIRRYHPQDREALYRICLATGDSGEDATGLYADPDLLGHVYVGPYLALEPSLAFVLTDDQGPAGYVLGALDTADFEARAEREWWPALRRRYPAPDDWPAPDDRPGPDDPAATPDERLVHLIHHPRQTPPERLTDYPSHLHIDLLPRAQGGGNGRRLMDTLLRALAARGSVGVHLGVGLRNERAIGFYRRLGFTILESRPDALILGLAL